MAEPWYNESLYINENPLKQAIFLPSLQKLQNASFFCQARYIIILAYLDCYLFFSQIPSLLEVSLTARIRKFLKVFYHWPILEHFNVPPSTPHAPLRVNLSAVLRTIIIPKKVGIFSLWKNLLWRFLQQISVSYKNVQKKYIFYLSPEIPQANIFELQNCVKNYFTYYWHYCMALTFMRGSRKCSYLLHGESVEILKGRGGGGS